MWAMKRLPEPHQDQLDLSRVLRALSDPTRRSILHALSSGPQPCNSFEVSIAKSTLSQHLKLLQESGLTHTDVQGRTHLTSLRTTDVEARFPGLLHSTGILEAEAPTTSPAEQQ